MKTGQKVKKYLEENGITQSWLARATGISEAKLSLTLTGKRIMKLEEIQLICGVLKVGFDKFLDVKYPGKRSA